MAGRIVFNPLQIGNSPTDSQNFQLGVPSVPDGTMKLSRGALGALGDIVTVDSSGNVTFNPVAVPAGGTTGVGIKVSTTANLGVFFGSGVPTLSAAQGSLYIRTDGSSTSTRMYINTNGSTTWTNVTTAA